MHACCVYIVWEYIPVCDLVHRPHLDVFNQLFELVCVYAVFCEPLLRCQQGGGLRADALKVQQQRSVRLGGGGEGRVRVSRGWGGVLRCGQAERWEGGELLQKCINKATHYVLQDRKSVV